MDGFVKMKVFVDLVECAYAISLQLKKPQPHEQFAKHEVVDMKMVANDGTNREYF